MADTENAGNTTASVEEMQKGWQELTLRVKQLEADRTALEHENKTLRALMERVIEHRQKSHGELVLLLTGLVSKLPINDVGLVVAKLVEHNAHVSEVLSVLLKGKAEAALPQPAILKALEQNKRDLLAVVKPTVEELIQLDAPLERDTLLAIVTQPETFFSPRVVRAHRCFVKGQVPRERVVREFGDEALAFFVDMTTDAKLNPRPKPDEIALAFKNDFEALFQQSPGLVANKRQDLQALYQRVQRSKGATESARAQRTAFQKLSFVLELLHYYDNQSTEAPEAIFAQRLPVLVEQLGIGPQDNLDEKLIKQVEGLLAFIISHDHRSAVVNNVGKGGGSARALKFVLKLRDEKTPADSTRNEIIPEFIKHLIAPGKAPTPQSLAAILKLITNSEIQRWVVRAIMDSDRLNKSESEALGKAVAKELGVAGLEVPSKGPESVPPEVERQLAWEKIKVLITGRADPGVIAKAIRDRLHAKYDSDELKQSWLTLIEVDPIALIRIFCALPYLPDGSTDAIARNVMETYVTRLTHEKYAGAYNKVVTSLRNMYKANPGSPTLLNFIALVKWVDAGSAQKLATDIGMPVTA